MTSCTGLHARTRLPEKKLLLFIMLKEKQEEWKNLISPQLQTFMESRVVLPNSETEHLLTAPICQALRFRRVLPLLNHGTFHSCFSLTNIAIPESVTSIAGKAFARCASLRNITIPKSVTRIEERAFQECKNLKNVHFMGPPPDSFTQAFYIDTILHYIEGTPGWTTPEWNGFTTRIWIPEP